MRHGDQYPYGTAARSIASYNKPAVALHALRGLVGQDAFMLAYRTYAERWKWKHPTPCDFFNTFEDVLGQDFDWFWTTMFFETWTLDQSIKDVDTSGDGIFVTVEDLGLSPMPLQVRVTYADGVQEEQVVPVDVWLEGARETTLNFDPGTVERVEIDPGLFLPDVNRGNNVWTGEAP
jgi:aminopeptidase N